MLNYKLNAQGGFTPGLLLPQCDNPPNRYYVIITKRRVGTGGQAHVPSFIVPARYISYHSKRNSTEPLFSELIPTTGSYEDFLPEGIMACIES